MSVRPKKIKPLNVQKIDDNDPSDNYIKVNVPVSKQQAKNLARSIEDKVQASLRLSYKDLEASDVEKLIPLYVTNRHYRKLVKSKQNKKGVVLQLSKNELNRNKKSFNNIARNLKTMDKNRSVEGGNPIIASVLGSLIPTIAGPLLEKLIGKGGGEMPTSIHKNNDYPDIFINDNDKMESAGLYLPHVGSGNGSISLDKLLKDNGLMIVKKKL